MDEINFNDYHSSMYTFYFISRRLLTGFGLVVFSESPLFQCNSLLVFSTINFIYLVNCRPFLSAKLNRIEIFNELTIIFCSHMYNIFLRGEGTIGFISTVGWVFIGAAAFNILGNFSIVIFESISDSGGKFVQWRTDKLKKKVIKERSENRE